MAAPLTAAMAERAMEAMEMRLNIVCVELRRKRVGMSRAGELVTTKR